MTDEKYDVFGDHLAGGVKWRYRQDRGQFYTKASGGLRPTLLNGLPTDVTNHVHHTWLSAVVSTNKAS